MKYTSDFLVIGSGIAGLSYALKVAEHGKVALVTKRDINTDTYSNNPTISDSCDHTNSN